MNKIIFLSLFLFTIISKAQNSCGTQCQWKFENNQITIFGSGEMNDYFTNAQPWFSVMGQVQTVVIEDEITSIGLYAFSGFTNLTTVIIGNNVTIIKLQAFSKCSKLSNLTFGTNVKTIESSAFHECTSLTKVVFPDNVKTIGDNAFWWCSGITSITFGKNLRTIGEYAFESCSSLKEVTFGNKLEFISKYAFYFCSKLETITIPASVRMIENYAFESCFKLTTIYFEGIEEPICDDKKTFEGDTTKRIIVPTLYEENDLCGETVEKSLDLILKNCGTLTKENGQQKVSCTCVGNATFTDKNETTCKCKDNYVLVNDNKCQLAFECFDLTIERGMENVTKCTCIDHAIFLDEKQNKCQCEKNYSLKNNKCELNEIQPDIPNDSSNSKPNQSNDPSDPQPPVEDKCQIQQDGKKVIISKCSKITQQQMKEYSSTTESIEIKEGIKIIGSRSFEEYTKLETVIIGKDIEQIEQKAFSKCRNIKEVKYYGDEVLCDENVFEKDIVRQIVVTAEYKTDKMCGIVVFKQYNGSLSLFILSVVLILLIL